MVPQFKNLWSEDEITLIKEKYEELGPKKCSEILNRTPRSCQIRANKLGIKYKSTKSYYEKENLDNFVKESKSLTDCLKKMGLSGRPGNYGTLRKYIKLYGIDTSHFYTTQMGGLTNYVIKLRKPLEEILVENSTFSRAELKRKLISEGLKQNICEECGQGEIWRGKKITIILDHINGVNDDNRIENLRMLCPNCNATLDTHCSKNRKPNQ